LHSYPLEGIGWATLELSADRVHAYVGNFFSGIIAKIDLRTGAEVGSVRTGVSKSLAGIAEFRGQAGVRTSPERASERPKRIARVSKRRRAKRGTSKKRKPSKPRVVKRQSVKRRSVKRRSVKRRASKAARKIQRRRAARRRRSSR
jgi:hypothetical protein